MRADVLDYVGFFVDYQSSLVPNYLACHNPCIPLQALPFIWADYSKLRAGCAFQAHTAPYQKFGSVRFLTSRQADFSLKRTPSLVRLNYVSSTRGAPDGRSPGERKKRNPLIELLRCNWGNVEKA